jgi:YaiO family outer membrane protein
MVSVQLSVDTSTRRVFFLLALIAMGLLPPSTQASEMRRETDTRHLSPDRISNKLLENGELQRTCDLATEAKFEKAKRLSWAHRYDDSLKVYRELVESCPWNSDFLVGMADVSFWAGDTDAATDLYRRALLVSPERIDAHQGLAKALKKKGDSRGLEGAIHRAKNVMNDQQHANLVSYVAGLDYSTEPASLGESKEWEAELGGGYESLNHGYKDWSSSFIGVKKKAPDQTIYGRVAELNRFGLTDAALTAGVTQKFLDHWTGTLETYDSPTGHFIPQWSMLGSIRYQTGWPVGIEFGFRHASYRTINNEIGTVTLDGYVDQLRLAGTLYMSDLQGAGGVKFSGLLDASWYYGESDYVGLMLGYGTQPVIVSPGVYRNDQVQTYLVRGLQEIAGPFALYYDAGVIVQGSSYTRAGANLALKYSF